MKPDQGTWKAMLAIGLLTPLSMAMAQTTPPSGTVPTPQELAPKPQPSRNVDVPRPAPPRELGKPA
ncbi:hypothetical protein LWT65_23780, partial [Enterobacter hormaechei]|nr:hypothetical protein [Enterobacter hormaechei]